MIVDYTAKVAVLAVSQLAETKLVVTKKTATLPLGLQLRHEGRCDHFNFDREYGCYDCKHLVTVAAETSTSRLKIYICGWAL